MAKQTGVLLMKGSVLGLNFYQTRESGELVRKKSSLDRARVNTDPAFEGSRKASSEFGNASKGARLLRSSMKLAGHELADTRIISRLTGTLQRVIGTDPLHEKGQRQLDNADLGGLIGFDWNKHASFSRLLSEKLSFFIDRETGLMEIDLPAMDGRMAFQAPKSASHVELVLEGVSLNFREELYERTTDSSGWLSLDETYAARSLMGRVRAIEGRRLLLGIGIRFGAWCCGEMHPVHVQSSKAFFVGAVV